MNTDIPPAELPPKPKRKRRIPRPAAQVPPGSAPGTLAAAPGQLPSRMTLMAYGPEGCVESVVHQAQDIATFIQKWPHVWVHVSGLSDVKLIEQLGTAFGMDRLVLEDVLNVNHRPKVEEYEQYLFLIMKPGKLGAETEQFETEHFSMVIREHFILTFQESSKDLFAPVRDRIKSGVGRIRTQPTDYLAYALIDAILDGYYPILERYNFQLEKLENDIITDQGTAAIRRIHHVKSDLLFMHRAVYPLRDILKTLRHEEGGFFCPGTVRYLGDCYDQAIEVTELTEFYRDVASGLMNTFLAYSGHKMNEIMKVLTMISAIFIPLSFIAGVYGMNFNTQTSPLNMPELHWYYGYPMALAVMALIAFVMLMMFERRGWLRKSADN